MTALETADCASRVLGDFNMPLKIGGLFSILVTSGLGVGLPLIAGWMTGKDGKRIGMSDAAAFGKGEGVTRSLFFLARHFGTGIIMSTSFIHLLYEGLISFADPCLGSRLEFDPVAPALTLAGAFITFLFDFIGTRQRAASIKRQSAANAGEGHALVAISAAASPLGPHGGDSGSSTPRAGQDSGGMVDQKHPASPPAGAVAAPRPARGPQILPKGDCCSNVDLALQAEQGWQVMLLEAGIIFHSIMIGVTLGADSSDTFTTLLVVIIFHQFFEGAALGSRIAMLTGVSKVRSFFMALAFTMVTPVGMAIGIGVRSYFSGSGSAEIVSVGVFNSFSAGILLYTAFQLMSADFTDGPLREAPAWKASLAVGVMAFGMACMAFIGKFA